MKVLVGFSYLGAGGKEIRHEIGDIVTNLPDNVEADLLEQGVLERPAPRPAHEEPATDHEAPKKKERK